MKRSLTIVQSGRLSGWRLVHKIQPSKSIARGLTDIHLDSVLSQQRLLQNPSKRSNETTLHSRIGRWFTSTVPTEGDSHYGGNNHPFVSDENVDISNNNDNNNNNNNNNIAYSTTLSDLVDSTDMLLNFPVGSFSEEVWEQAEETVQKIVANHRRHLDVALALLERMIQESIIASQEKYPLPFPTDLVDKVLKECSKISSPKLARLAQRMVETLWDHYEAGRIQTPPDSAWWNYIMRGWIHCSATTSPGRRAWKILEQWQECYRHYGMLIPKPDLDVYKIVLLGFTKEGNIDFAEQVLEELLHRTNLPPPDRWCFHNVLVACSNANNPHRTDVWLERMKVYAASSVSSNQKNNNNITGSSSVQPNIGTYRIVLEAWSKATNGKIASERADALLEELRQAILSGAISMTEPSLEDNGKERSDCATKLLYCYNMTLNALAKTGNIDRAEAILWQMFDDPVLRKHEPTPIQPDNISFRSVLKACDKAAEQNPALSAKAAERADSILRRMTELYRTGQLHAKPETRTYSTVLGIWARSNRGKRIIAALPALKLLSEMEQAFRDTGDDRLKPDIACYRIVIDLLVKCGNPKTAEKAEEVLRGMQQLLIEDDRALAFDSVSCNSVLHSWAKSDSLEAGERAEAFLNELIERGFQPDTLSYNIVINAYAKALKVLILSKDANDSAIPASDAPEHAERILMLMQELHDTKAAPTKPSVRTYDAVLNCWAQSHRSQAGERAEGILRNMQKLYLAGDKDVQPSTVTYNIVLNAYANGSTPSTEVMRRAESLIAEMSQQEHSMPNRDTYATLMKLVLASDLPDKVERVKSIRRVIHRLTRPHDRHEYGIEMDLPPFTMSNARDSIRTQKNDK